MNQAAACTGRPVRRYKRAKATVSFNLACHGSVDRIRSDKARSASASSSPELARLMPKSFA